MNKTRQVERNSLVNVGGNMAGKIQVQPRDSVPSEAIAQNARDNITLLPKSCWISKGKLHDEVAWLVSAGPSLDRLLTNGFLRKEWFQGDSKNKLFTVKHALPTLAKHGLAPHFCVVLDPRPIQGISTHGYLRETLYSKAPKSTKFLVASMTHPSVTSWLIKNGYEIYGWHSAANGLISKNGAAEGPLQHVTNFVQGGTCSATRSISLSHYMGFRKCNLVAYDSNLSGKPAEADQVEEIEGKEIRKYWPVRIGNNEEFWTTGELIAQIQDLQNFLSDEIADIEINIVGADRGTSLVGCLNDTIVNKTHLKNYHDLIGTWKS